MYLIYRWSLIVKHWLPLMITVIVVLVIPYILGIFPLTILLGLIFRDEFELFINFGSKWIDELLKLILATIESPQRYFAAAFHFIDLYLQLDRWYGIIWSFCLIWEGVATHKHLFQRERLLVDCSCKIVFCLYHLETKDVRDLREQLEDLTLGKSEWNVNFQKRKRLL